VAKALGSTWQYTPLEKLNDKIDSFRDNSSSKSVMQVKAIEMALTKLDNIHRRLQIQGTNCMPRPETSEPCSMDIKTNSQHFVDAG